MQGPQDRQDRFEHFDPYMGGFFKLVGLASLLGGPLVLFGLFFQPSWANGWGSLAQRDVFSWGFALMAGLDCLLISAGLASLWALEVDDPNRPFAAWRLFAAVEFGALVGVIRLVLYVHNMARSWFP